MRCRHSVTANLAAPDRLACVAWFADKIQVSKKQLEVHRWEKDNRGTDKPVPSWVASARSDIKTARQNVSKNTYLQRELEMKERDLREECDMLRDQVRRVALNEERRMLLDS